MMEIMMEMSFSFHTTKDFNLAAFLWCFTKEGEHTNLEEFVPHKDKNKVVLFFKFKLPLTKEDTDKLVLSYLNSECSVEPRAFAAAMGKLRDIIQTQKL
jgi:hypothetical protein